MRGTDVQEGRKLARLETISAVIYDALLVFQLCISRRGNELAAMLYVHTSMDIAGTNLFFLLSFNSFVERVERLTDSREGGRGGESDRGEIAVEASIHAIVFDNRLIGCSLHPYSTLSPLIL